MKKILLALMLLPALCTAQQWIYDGVYMLPDNKDPKVRLKVWDTIRQVFTFTPDSFKYSYAVMRPNGKVAVSVDYEEYGTWKIVSDSVLSGHDKRTGNEYLFNRMWASLDDGRIQGYFEQGFAADSSYNPANGALVFVRNRKVFSYTGKVVGPLKKQ